MEKITICLDDEVTIPVDSETESVGGRGKRLKMYHRIDQWERAQVERLPLNTSSIVRGRKANYGTEDALLLTLWLLVKLFFIPFISSTKNLYFTVMFYHKIRPFEN